MPWEAPVSIIFKIEYDHLTGDKVDRLGVNASIKKGHVIVVDAVGESGIIVRAINIKQILKYLSNPGSLWMGKIVVVFFSVIVLLLIQDAIRERNWIALPLPLFFLPFTYFMTMFNVVKFDNDTIVLENIYRVKGYDKSEFAQSKQGIPLPDYYKLVLKNGDSYHFRRGYSQTKFLSIRDGSKEAKEIEAELKRYME